MTRRNDPVNWIAENFRLFFAYEERIKEKGQSSYQLAGLESDGFLGKVPVAVLQIGRYDTSSHFATDKTSPTGLSIPSKIGPTSRKTAMWSISA